jgi:tyrosine-protein kinase Etk/Wzc
LYSITKLYAASKYYLSMYFKYRLLFAGSILFCLAVAFIYEWFYVPQYRVSSTIRLLVAEAPTTGGPEIFSTAATTDDQPENAALLYHQTEVLNSKSLVRKTIDALSFEVSYHTTDFVRKTELYGNTLPVSVIVEHATADSPKHAFVIKSVDRQHFELQEDGVATTYAFNRLIRKPYASFKVTHGPAFAMRHKAVRVQFADSDLLTERYYYKLAARLVPDENSVVELRIDETVPERGVNFIQKLTEIYYRENVGDHAASGAAIAFITTRLDKLKAEITRLDSVKARHERNRSGRHPAPEKTKPAKEAEDIRARHVKAMKAIKPYAQSPLNQFTILPDHFDVGDSSLLQLISLYNKAQIDKQILLRTHEADHPLLTESILKLAALQSSLVQTIEVKINRLTDAIRADEHPPGKGKAKETVNVLTHVSKQRQAKVTLYLHLLQKRAEISEQAELAASTFTVINKPQDHVSPIKAKSGGMYFLALVFGMCLPMLFLNQRGLGRR